MAPVINQLSPVKNEKGTKFQIQGTDLQNPAGDTPIINFGSTVITADTYTPTLISGALVPNLALGPYDVTVDVDASVSNAEEFTIVNCTGGIKHIIESSNFTADDIIKAIDNNDAYLDRTDNKYCEFLEDFGIQVFESPDPLTASNKVIETLICYCTMIIARDEQGYDYRTALDGLETDPYQDKYENYKKDFLEKKNKLTFDILMQRLPRMGVGSGRIRRG